MAKKTANKKTNTTTKKTSKKKDCPKTCARFSPDTPCPKSKTESKFWVVRAWTKFVRFLVG